MVLSEGNGTIFNVSQVIESSEMPPLPVSRMKFRLSGKLFSFALIRIKHCP